MKLAIPVHSSKLFTYNIVTKTFTTEASNIVGKFMGRIYDDACDMGFLMESSRTGDKKLFYLSKEHCNPFEPEEITHWEFESQSGHFKAIIFND
jgi:hypothetical protein